MHTLANYFGGSALVVKEYSIHEEGPVYVHLSARRAGLVSWLLTLMGIDDRTTLDVYSDHVKFTTSSLSGTIVETIPLSAISVSGYGYLKPVLWLFFALLFLLATPVTLGLALIPSLLCLLFYFLRKNIFIELISHSGVAAFICVKRSVIEGVNIDQNQAYRIISIIEQLITYQTRRA